MGFSHRDYIHTSRSTHTLSFSVPTNPATRNIEKHKLQTRLFINVTLGQWNSSSLSKAEASAHHMPHHKLSCASTDSLIFFHSSCECACMIIAYKMKENKWCLSRLETLKRQKGKQIHMPVCNAIWKFKNFKIMVELLQHSDYCSFVCVAFGQKKIPYSNYYCPLMCFVRNLLQSLINLSLRSEGG